MHKQPVKEVEFRKVTFPDVTTSPSQEEIPPVSPVAIEPSTNQPRRSERVSHPPERFVLGVDYVLITDGGEPSCYKEAMLA